MIIKFKKPFKNNILHNLALILPAFIFLGILGGVAGAFIVNRPDFLIRASIVAIPGILGAAVLQYMYGSFKENREYDYSSLNISEKRIVKLFIIFYLLSIISLFMSTTRPVYYFIIILILYGIIFVHIFNRSSNHNIVLLEIFFLLMNLTYSVTLKYALYFGGTDIPGHIFFSEVTFLSGHTIPADLSVSYANFPLFHILVSQASFFLGSSIQTSYFVVSAPAFAISTFFVYLIMFNISADRRISLLSALFFSSLDVAIYSGMYVVTRTMAFLGFIIILYLMFHRNSKKSPFLKIVCILFGTYIILVHQVSILQIIVVFFFILFVENAHSRIMKGQSTYISHTYMLLLLVSFIGYWLFVSYAFTVTLGEMYFDSTNYESATTMKPTIHQSNQWIFVLNNMSYTVITFLAIIGIGGTMYKDKNTYLQVFALVALLILPLYIPTPLQLFWNTMTFFRFDRFSLLVSPFIAFMMALGIMYLMEFIKSKRINKNYIYSISIVLILLLATFSIISTAPESDYGMDPERKYFNSAEVAGFNYVSDHVPYGSRLHSDYYTRRYLPYHRFSLSEDLGIPYYTGSFRNSLDIDNIDVIEGYILWRDKAFFESGLRLGSGGMIDIRASNLTERNLVSSGFERKNKIYSNSHMDIYH